MDRDRACWTRAKIGRNRVHWVAYDNRVGAEGCRVLDQGYSASLSEADKAARASLADAGYYQARRMSSSPRRPLQAKPARPADRSKPQQSRPREYLYSRRPNGPDDFLIAAHLVTKKTAKKIRVSLKSIGPDQLSTTDERWDDDEPSIALDRIKLERDGSVYSSAHRFSDFFATRAAAMAGAGRLTTAAFSRLGIVPPASVEEIKAAYRREALKAHPDRGGKPEEFHEVESAYRHLMLEAQASDDPA